MLKLIKTICLVGMLSMFFSDAQAEVVLKKISTPNGKRWLMENSRMRLEINPEKGGRVSSFIDKQFDGDAIKDFRQQGLFCDHFDGQGWPGELWDAVYDVKELPAQGNEKRLEMRTVFKDKSTRYKLPESSGVVIVKTYCMKDDTPGIDVLYRLENPTKTQRSFKLWIQNVLQLGKNYKETNLAIRPYSTGVERFIMPKQPHGWSWKNWPEMTAAWTGVMDTETGQGVFFIPDYDYLYAHYNAGPAYTVEWFMMKLFIQPGKSWETKVKMLCGKVDSDLVGINEEFWVGASLSKDEKTIALNIVSASDKTDEFSVKGIIRGLQTQRNYPLEMENLKTGKLEIKLPKGCFLPVFISADISDGVSSVHVEEYLGGGTFPVNESYVGGPPFYRATPAVKHSKFQTPEKMELSMESSGRVLLVNGSLTDNMNITGSLQSDKLIVDNSYEFLGGFSSGFHEFPTSYKNMLSYGSVILNNANTMLLSAFQKSLIEEYVKAGGHLIVLSGTSTMNSKWEQTVIFKLSKCTPTNGERIHFMDLIGTKGDSPLISLLPQKCYGSTWAKGTGKTIVTVDGKPFVSSYSVGKGMITFCGISGMGETVPGNYWESDQWKELLVALISKEGFAE